jgi:hypothetical protein
MQQEHMVTLKWLRPFGDTIFATGSVALAWFVFRLKGGMERGEGGPVSVFLFQQNQKSQFTN